MEAQHLGEGREKDLNQELDNNRASTTPLPSSSPPPPPPSATSPSHEFSFTITLHPPFTTSTPKTSSSLQYNSACNKNSTPPFTVDLAPADEIFFHGHLLPLHNLPPRPSATGYVESGSLPAACEHNDSNRHLKFHDAEDHQYYNHHIYNDPAGACNKERIKAKTFFSYFGLGKLRKGVDNGEKEEEEKKDKKAFHVSRFLKKYASMMVTLFSFKGADHEKEKRDIRRRPSTFSGYSNRGEAGAEGWRRKRVQFSAPASMRTSPTNSGLLSDTSTMTLSSDASTMEELQSAIQAAIAHCKNSVAMKEDTSCK